MLPSAYACSWSHFLLCLAIPSKPGDERGHLLFALSKMWWYSLKMYDRIKECDIEKACCETFGDPVWRRNSDFGAETVTQMTQMTQMAQKYCRRWRRWCRKRRMSQMTHFDTDDAVDADDAIMTQGFWRKWRRWRKWCSFWLKNRKMWTQKSEKMQKVHMSFSVRCPWGSDSRSIIEINRNHDWSHHKHGTIDVLVCSWSMSLDLRKKPKSTPTLWI